MRIVSIGHALLAATLIGLGIFGLIKGAFTEPWDSAPDWLPAHHALASLAAAITLASGLGLVWRRTAALAARVLLAWLLLWTLVVKGYYIVLTPLSEGPYQSCGESLVLVAGTWVLYAWFAGAWDRRGLALATGDDGVRIARVLYGLALIAFGLSHFVYLENTAPLVPAWMHGPVSWSYLTGGAYLAAGVAVLTGVWARLAAVLSVLQMGLITLLVWVPLALAGRLTAFQWNEFPLSWALTAAACVVAESYGSLPWLAFDWRRHGGAHWDPGTGAAAG